MKGISTVVATILMLMITIALAGVAYMYITGVFNVQTAVSLSVNSNTSCVGNLVTVGVSNSGTAASSTVSVSVANSVGTTWSCNIASVPASGASSCQVTKTAGLGYYQITASSGSEATPKTPLYCSS